LIILLRQWCQIAVKSAHHKKIVVELHKSLTQPPPITKLNEVMGKNEEPFIEAL